VGKYAINFQAFGITTSLKTGLKITCIAAKPIEVVEYAVFGAGSVAAADIQAECHMTSLSAAGAGTSTAQTPAQLTGSGGAASSTAGTNYSAEPTTYVAVPVVQFGINTRGGFRWAVPQGEGVKSQFELTNMHVGMRVKGVSAASVDMLAHWWEQ
jgi:hypothetical protein